MRDWFEKVRDWICRDCLASNAMLRQELDVFKVSEESLIADVHELQNRVRRLTAELSEEERVEELEEYWNTKREPTNDYRYNARVFDGNRTGMDPRVFFTPNNNIIPVVGGDSVDEIAYNALSWVIRHVDYTTDTKQFDSAEHWLFPFETLKSRQGDCEDGGILLANVLLASGVPYWRVRLNAGNVKGGGHCWVTYLRESDDRWVVLDWCYWPRDSLEGLHWDSAENYFDIWFSWNQYYIFAGDMLDREGED